MKAILSIACAFSVLAAESDLRAEDPTAPDSEGSSRPRWYDAVKLEAFVDAYFSFNANLPKPQTGTNHYRAYDTTNGFAIHWAGLNAQVAPEPVGGVVGLRFGPGAVAYNGSDSAFGLLYVKQAFASWKPLGKGSKVTLDLGKYDQPFGSEVADSQYDVNYTRSALYWLAQPLFFTGLRADLAISEAVDLKLVAANGWNNAVDNDQGKTFGGQLNVKPIDTLVVSLGYVAGPEQADFVPGAAATATEPATPPASVPGANAHLRHLVDLIADWSVTAEMRALLNADFGHESFGATSASWYGANLALRWAPASIFSLGMRGEYYVDADGFTTGNGQKTALAGGTITLGVTPTPNLVVKLDQRVDFASLADGSAVFPRGASQFATTQVTTTLGVVATTN